MAWFQKDDVPATPVPGATPSAAAPKAVKIGPLLSEATVLFPAGGLDKAAVLEQLVRAVAAKAGLADPGAVLAKVLEREQGISTTLDTGLSLPHARLVGIDGILAGLAVLKAPLVDPKQPELSIRAVFLFFSPDKREAFPLHLQLLRGVASLFQAPLIERLSASPGPADALALIRHSEG
ncbi:MAG: PTS transporter subunit EIIA [Elusimicrobia bacterium]|nr:PTS transporter subunit EIIA [Elusimicrobiota bacterium]